MPEIIEHDNIHISLEQTLTDPIAENSQKKGYFKTFLLNFDQFLTV